MNIAFSGFTVSAVRDYNDKREYKWNNRVSSYISRLGAIKKAPSMLSHAAVRSDNRLLGTLYI